MLARISLIISVLVLLAAANQAQETADPSFKAIVEHPAYSKGFPRVLFDEGHNNLHTRMGRYKPFADLIEMDGYQVVLSRKPFTKESLDSFKIMVVADPLGAEEADDEGAGNSAFTDSECDIVREWVKNGGSLLLIADEAPFGSAAENLAKRFGVIMSQGTVRDPAHHETDNDAWIVYSRDNKLLMDHPITSGRDDAEKLNRVVTFAGQSLQGPEGSSILFRLSETAVDSATPAAAKDSSAVGRAQGIALKFGKGRVAVLGDAAMLSAQLSGREQSPVGINYPGIDNERLVLNLMHWLSGLLKDR